jgi:hypothetical protein
MTTTKKTTTTTKKTPTKSTSRRTQPTKSNSKNDSPVKKIELNENSLVHEIFSAVSAERTTVKKVEILRKYNENYIKSVLIWNFDDTIKSDLPEGEVPIQPKENPEDRPSTSIKKEWSNFYNFVRGGNDGMVKLRKETMFINILENLHPLEAEVLILVKDKKLKTKYNITKELVSEAYPDIQWGNRV